jgi:hypothetical protein
MAEKMARDIPGDIVSEMQVAVGVGHYRGLSVGCSNQGNNLPSSISGVARAHC